MTRKIDSEVPNPSRREFMRQFGQRAVQISWLSTISGLLISCQPVKSTAENNKTITGNLITEGKILSETELVSNLSQKIKEDQPLELEPTMIKSIFYNALIFHNTKPEIAKDRTNRISFSQDYIQLCGEERAAACTVSADGASVATVLTPGLVTNYGSTTLDYVQIISSLAHEAKHASPNNVTNTRGEENYGILGKYQIQGDVRGFHRQNKFISDSNGLEIPDQINSPESKLPFYLSDFAEEFVAELGATAYTQHLGQLGLNNTKNYFDYTSNYQVLGYPWMAQALIDFSDTTGTAGHASWQRFWQGKLTLKTVNEFYLSSNRRGFYALLGSVVLNLNTSQTSVLHGDWSIPDMAGLGMISLMDFIFPQATQRNVLGNFALAKSLTPQLLLEQAKMLVSRLKQF